MRSDAHPLGNADVLALERRDDSPSTPRMTCSISSMRRPRVVES